MTVFFPSDTFTVKRYRGINGLKLSASATFTAGEADIQPMGAARTNESGGRIGKMYEAWIDDSFAVQESDQIVTPTRTYTVKTVSSWAGAGLLDSKYLILEAQD